MRVEDRINALLNEGINIYEHEFLLAVPDSSLVFYGDVRYTGAIIHRPGTEVHLFKNEELILKRSPFVVVARYENGVEVTTPHHLVDEKLEEKLTENPIEKGYTFAHPLLQYLLARLGITEEDLEKRFSDELVKKELLKIKRPLKKLERRHVDSQAESSTTIAPGASVYRSWSKDARCYLYSIELQHHRLISNPKDLWIPIRDFFLPAEKYKYNSTSIMPQNVTGTRGKIFRE